MEEQNIPAVPAPAQAPAKAAGPETQAKPSQTRLWLKIIAVLYAASLVASFAVIAKLDDARKSKIKNLDLSNLTGLNASKKDAVAVIPIFGAIYQTDSSKMWERGSQQIAKRIRQKEASADKAYRGRSYVPFLYHRRNGHAEDAHRPEQLKVLVRIFVVLVPTGRLGSKLALARLVQGCNHLLLFLSEGEVHYLPPHCFCLV